MFESMTQSEVGARERDMWTQAPTHGVSEAKGSMNSESTDTRSKRRRCPESPSRVCGGRRLHNVPAEDARGDGRPVRASSADTGMRALPGESSQLSQTEKRTAGVPTDDHRGKRRARGEGELGEESSVHCRGQTRDPTAGRPAPDGLPAVKSRTDGRARTLSTASHGQQAQETRTDILARAPLATRVWEEAGQEGLSGEPRRE